MKVLVACCTLTSINLGPYLDHTKLWYRVGREFPHIDFIQMGSKRMSIDRFRNEAMRIALDNAIDYIYFIDDDMLLPPDTFAKLLEGMQQYDILSALNYIRGYPFKIMSYKWDLSSGHKRLMNITEEDLPNPLSGILPVNAIGTAVCLIRVNVFKQVPAPWFLTGPHGTEDIYMCLKAKDYAPYIRIGTHLEIITGHMLDPEVISHRTRAAHMDYVESFMSHKELQEARQEDTRLAQVPNREKGFRRELTYEELMHTMYKNATSE